jgi:hypothetical protein
MLNGTHKLLVYADDVNILDGSIHTIKKNTEALVVASKENGLEVNADRTMYIYTNIHLMYISHTFRCLCTVIRENNYASYLKTNYSYNICICGFIVIIAVVFSSNWHSFSPC